MDQEPTTNEVEVLFEALVGDLVSPPSDSADTSDDFHKDRESLPFALLDDADGFLRELEGRPHMHLHDLPWQELEDSDFGAIHRPLSSEAALYTKRVTSDAIAVYKPWHLYREGWGIVYNGPVFHEVVSLIHEACQSIVSRGDKQSTTGLSRDSVEMLAFEQVLRHEQFHFEVELRATELEACAHRPLYVEYLKGYGEHKSAWTDGPLEEALATGREVAFARSIATQGRELRLGADVQSWLDRYAEVIERWTRTQASGYCHWNRVANDPHSTLANARLTQMICSGAAHAPVVHPASLLDSIPLRWFGPQETVPRFALQGPSVPKPTVKRFERWLRDNGASIDSTRGKGSHRRFEWNGRPGFYAVSSGHVYPKVATSVASVFGLPSGRELFEHVHEGRIVAPDSA